MGLKMAPVTCRAWPRKTAVSVPESTRQRRAARSSPEVTTRSPLGLKATPVRAAARGSSDGAGEPAAGVPQARLFRPGRAVASTSWVGLKATPVTAWVCPAHWP